MSPIFMKSEKGNPSNAHRLRLNLADKMSVF